MADKAGDVQVWIDHISKYEREFQVWEKRVKNILEVYRDDKYKSRKTAKFNILWANVQTLVPATYAKLPQPDVARRFKDQDPIGRVAGMILERALDFEVQHYPDYRATLKQCVYDRFLGGRGTAWARYEPHIVAKKQGLPEDGVQVTEDTDAPDETLEYECAPTDYVHWKDFGHTVARTWEEVTAVWRKVYMTRQACIERFGPEMGEMIPLDSRPDDQRKGDLETKDSRALIFEIWDKETEQAIWLSKSLGKIVDQKDDPLQVEGFFPCPRPLFATLTNESLVPVPDYALYQDQAQALDIICDRIDGLIKALQVRGVYNAEFTELARLFTEGQNGTMIPVKNFAAFAEKQGLRGAIDMVDLNPIFGALQAGYEAMREQKNQIHEITGLSDIVRGQSDPNETATAQGMKGQYAGLRLSSMKQDVALFATEILQLKAQIMCAKFDPQTLLKMSAADQMSEQDRQLIPQALEMLTNNPLRSFRIEIAADSLVNIDEQAEKLARTEFLTAVGSYIREALPLVQQAPQVAPMVVEMLKFGVAAFKVGKSLEGVIDEVADQIREAAKNPAPPPPNPEMIKAQSAQQLQASQQQHEAQIEQMKAQLAVQTQQQEMALKQQSDETNAQREMQLEQWKQQMQAAQIEQQNLLEAHREAQKQELERSLEQRKQDLEAQAAENELAFSKWKSQLESATKVTVAQLSAGIAIDPAASEAIDSLLKVDMGGPTLADLHTQTLATMQGIMDAMSRPKTVVRDENGKITGVS